MPEASCSSSKARGRTGLIHWRYYTRKRRYNKAMKYIALLRGINVGGNNKVSMGELRDCFEHEGLTNVSTYINSGNVLFESVEADAAKLVTQCENALGKRFGFPIITMVIAASDFAHAIDGAPDWWGDTSGATRNDALFVIPPTTAREVLDEIQKKASAVDSFAIHGQVLFWTLPKADYNKSVVPKIMGTPIYRRVTIRSSTTVRRLYDLSA